ncbi:uncharacterized protein ACA1_000790 [Acanthamoeba castellanii str. Neff]|uniref:Uncharacterized protein n=1 Tax=Acanthamoeba castellanii (strain ATCC 30010 / Neff) TaxID=1257118 RepID=L8H6X2_ACACF|nr:uncharacterized protein ACA1_000790 [Acanthamoeba castellanii str. Neff]ELR20478.1 hypothetical protein ACA1_000790 [Acanthamoeba castellanii str. Neff]
MPRRLRDMFNSITPPQKMPTSTTCSTSSTSRSFFAGTHHDDSLSLCSCTRQLHSAAVNDVASRLTNGGLHKIRGCTAPPPPGRACAALLLAATAAHDPPLLRCASLSPCPSPPPGQRLHLSFNFEALWMWPVEWWWLAKTPRVLFARLPFHLSSCDRKLRRWSMKRRAEAARTDNSAATSSSTTRDE